MAKPLYYRSTNPGLSGVTARANKLYEWDGTGSMPTEIQNGKAFMPPAEISGETVIWSDTYTLGYTTEANAAPIFYSDGAAGEVKVLEMINHIAGRLNQTLFADLASAKAWIATAQGVDFVEAGAITVSNKVYDIYSLENMVNGEWLPGMMNYISSAYAGQAWQSATFIPVNVIDANGVNRQAELLAATSIKIYHDASNYVTFDVTSASVDTSNGYYNYPPFDVDPNIVNTVVVLSVANPVAVGVAPSVANPSVTLLINGENPVSGGGSGVVADAYYINADSPGGTIVYNNGQILGINGSTMTPSAWDSTTQLSISRYDAYGNDRLADFQDATQLRIEVDASNYVVYNVTFTQIANLLFTNGQHPHLQFNATLASSAGQRPVVSQYSVNPQFVTLTNPAAGAGSGSGTTVALNAGPLTFIIENNTGNETIRGIFTDAGNYFGLGESVAGVNLVEWMPLAAGESLTLTGLPIYANDRAQLQTNFFNQANYTLNTFVNDVAAETLTLFTNGFSYATYRAGNQPIQSGDVVRFVYTKA